MVTAMVTAMVTVLSRTDSCTGAACTAVVKHITELTQMGLVQGMAVVLSREPIFLCPRFNY